MKKNGFTLMELMIVIAIIMIIAAIGIPSMLRARISANEATAIGSLRTMSTAEIQYQNAGIDTTNSINQFGDLNALSAATPQFLDEVLGNENGFKSGYIFSTSITTGTSLTPASFHITAVSLSETLGTRNFYIDIEGAIFWIAQSSGVPSSTDTPL